MKKSSIIALAAVVMMSGCGTYTGSGAYTGASLGSILGSAIGGISGGPRGSDIGTIVGMASGAIVGGAIGQRADQQRDADMDQYRRDKADRAARRQQRDAARQQHNGSRYLALVPAGSGNDDEEEALEVSILKSVEENGEEFLEAIEDDAELEEVYSALMDLIYEEDDAPEA